jgi:hypothetical protein
MTETARERAWLRWWQPIEVAPDAPLGEDVERYPLSRDEVELAAAYGPLDQESRVEALADAEYAAQLEREQREATLDALSTESSARSEEAGLVGGERLAAPRARARGSVADNHEGPMR